MQENTEEGETDSDKTERKDGTIYTQWVIREVVLSRGMRHR